MPEPMSPDGPVKVAVTVDDFFQWDGVPFPDGYTAEKVIQSLLKAFERSGLPPVYAFSNTRPVDHDAGLLSLFDEWCEAGNHIGNHTHHHASLNWVDAGTYIADIERAEEVIGSWIDQAPTRYFRYCMDMWGDKPEKTADVQAYLARSGYIPAPVTTWFYDAQFMVPYWRTLATGNEDDRAFVQKAFVETAVSQLRNQVAASRAAIGRDVPHIALVHGTAVAADTYERVLEAYADHGVEFITLEEAMQDAANQIPPPVTTRMFRNFTQKWAEYAGIEVEDAPAPGILGDVAQVSPVEGLGEAEILGPAILKMAESLGAEATLDEFDWHRHPEGADA